MVVAGSHCSVLFVAGFVLLFGRRLVAPAIEVAHRFATAAPGPDVVMGNGVSCLGRKGVRSEELHEKHQGFCDRFIFGAKHGRHGGRGDVDIGLDVHNCAFGKRSGENMLKKSLVGAPVVFV